MANVHQGNLIGTGKKFAVVVSRFNEFLTSRLLSGALDAFTRHGVAENDVDVFWVPGAFETPVCAQKVAESGKYSAVVCLGAVVRGHTPHFEFIASQVARGTAAVAQQCGLPVIFGVITADTLEQAIERAGAKSGNKGADAAVSAIEMANLFQSISGKKR